MRPACWNRPPRADGRHRVGMGEDGQVVRVFLSNAWFVDRCATWDGAGIGPNGEPYPAAHGWDCTGCRWRPEGT